MLRQLVTREYYFTAANKEEIVGLAHVTGITSLTDIFSFAIPFASLTLSRIEKRKEGKEIVIPPQMSTSGKKVEFEYTLGNSPDELLDFVAPEGLSGKAYGVQCKLSGQNLEALDSIARTYNVLSKGDIVVFCCAFARAVLESLPPNTYVRRSYEYPTFSELCRAG